MGVNGVRAANRLAAFTNLQYGMCLYYVWQAYKAEGAVANGTYPTALAGWNGSPGKHEGDRNPPAGVPVWFGAKAGSSAGDVVISLGGGRVVATDFPRYGVVGITTIDERQRQIGRPYLGWTETILGAAIDFGGSGAGSGGTADLNAGQRTVGSSIVRRRSQPTSQSAEAGDPLQPRAIGNFTGWIRGENVEGNNVWYQGTSGHWFWSGGFREGANGTGLKDLNAAALTPQQRRNANPANGRADATTSAAIRQTLDAGTVGNFDGWKYGESVEGENRWIHGAISGDWFWLGAFEPRNVDGLADLNASTPAPTPDPEPTPEPEPSNPDNPRGLPTYTPVYPGAKIGLVSPFTKGADRAKKGTTTVTPLIDRFIIHHTATTSDQLDWFSYENARSVSPSFYLRPSGEVIELIRPGLKPAATGPDWNYRSIAVETLNTTGAPEWKVSDAELEALAQMIAWLASFNGKTLDGVPVSFTIDRTHVIGHREAVATECPGPYIWARMDSIVARAKVIYAEVYGNTGSPPPEESDTVEVERSWLQSVLDKLKGILGK